MYVGKKVERDAIHCSVSPAYKQTRSCPGRVGVDTVFSGVGLLWTAPVRFAQPPRRGTLCWGDGEPNMRSTSGQDGDAHCQDDGKADTWEGLPA